MEIVLYFLLIQVSSEEIEIHGKKSIFYQTEEFYGNFPPGFYPYTYRYEVLSLNLKGSLRKRADISGEIYQNSSPGREDHFRLLLKNSHFYLQIGDHNSSFEKNSLIIGKSLLTGASFNMKYKIARGDFVYAFPKGNIKVYRFYGNSTQGPYFIPGSPIIPESEKVIKVYSEEMLQRGIDYEIDYFSGTITFLKGILKRDELIEITYESKSQEKKYLLAFRAGGEYFGYSEANLRDGNSKTGVMGFDASVPILKYGKISFESAFDKRNSQKIGAYGIESSLNYKIFSLNGTYKKFNPHYFLILDPYFLKGGYIGEIELSTKYFGYRKKEFKEPLKMEKEEEIKGEYKIFAYKWEERKVEERNIFISRTHKFYAEPYFKKNKFSISYEYGKLTNPPLSLSNSYFRRIEVGMNTFFLKDRANLSFKTGIRRAENFNENEIKGNINFLPLKNFLLTGEGFLHRSSFDKPSLVLKTGISFSPFNFLKINSVLQEEHKTVKQDTSQETKAKIQTFSVQSSITTFKGKFSFYPGYAVKKIKTAQNNSFYNYEEKNFLFESRPFLKQIFSYRHYSAYSKSYRSLKIEPVFRIFNILKSNVEISYHYLLTKGTVGLITGLKDTIPYSVSRIKSERIKINYNLKEKSSVDIIFKRGDSLSIRERYSKADYEFYSGKMRISRDLKEFLTLFIGGIFSRKKGRDTNIGEGFLDFWTSGPEFGIIGRFFNKVVLEGIYIFEKSMKKEVYFGSESIDLRASLNFTRLTLSSNIEYGNFLNPSYRKLKFSIIGELSF